MSRPSTRRSRSWGTHSGRGARDKNGQNFTSFLPAISKDAMKALNREIRSWRLHQHSSWTLGQLARWINPIVRGWLQYYGRFYRSALYVLCTRINTLGSNGRSDRQLF
jgi:RNA-directed DNA polymerase